MSELDLEELAEEFEDEDIFEWLQHQADDDLHYDDEAIAQTMFDLFKRIGQPLKAPPRIGSGEYARVYWLADKKRVLKLTTDPRDAFALAVLKKSHSTGIVNVYDVFKIPQSDLYGIVTEKLTPSSGSERHAWEIISDKIKEVYVGHGVPFQFTRKWYDRFVKEFEAGGPSTESNIMDPLKTVLTPDRLKTIESWCEELDRAGIQWADFHPGNLMFRRHQPVLMDLGLSIVSPINIPNM